MSSIHEMSTWDWLTKFVQLDPTLDAHKANDNYAYEHSQASIVITIATAIAVYKVHRNGRNEKFNDRNARDALCRLRQRRLDSVSFEILASSLGLYATAKLAFTGMHYFEYSTSTSVWLTSLHQVPSLVKETCKQSPYGAWSLPCCLCLSWVMYSNKVHLYLRYLITSRIRHLYQEEFVKNFYKDPFYSIIQSTLVDWIKTLCLLPLVVIMLEWEMNFSLCVFLFVFWNWHDEILTIYNPVCMVYHMCSPGTPKKDGEGVVSKLCGIINMIGRISELVPGGMRLAS